MSDISPRKPPSRAASHIPSARTKGGPAPKPHAPDPKLGRREDTEEGTFAPRGVPSGGLRKSSFAPAELETPGGASPAAEGQERKHVVRLTLAEAAEEIKRLRRLERQNMVQLKKQEEDTQNFLEENARLKQHLQDSERAHREEKNSMTSAYENEVKNLKGQLKATADELRLLQETSLPLVEARKLTFKALRKGRALQYMAQLYTNNTVLMTVKREALHKLLENAVGTDHAVFRATHGFACGVQSYTDSHLRLLRQEQLILLAENERLQAQIQDMQQRTEKSRRDRILQQESSVAGRIEADWLPQQSREASIAMSSSGSHSSGQPAWHRERLELQRLTSSPSAHGSRMKTRDLEMELTKMKLQSISGVLHIGKMRLLAYAFRRIVAYFLNASVVQTMESAISKSSLASRKKAVDTGSSLVMSVVRTYQKASMMRALWMFVLHLKTQAHAKECQVLSEQLNEAQQQAASTQSPEYTSTTCRACQAWSVLSSELNQTNASLARPPSMAQRGGDITGGFGIPPSQGGGIPLPIAYAPHYFRDLPSTQRRRNMYFTAAPPRVSQQNIPTTAQRARDMALTQETFYRPVTTAEGWQEPGANGLGIGMEPVGTVIGSHAISQDSKFDAAKEALKGTLVLPSTTPASQPLSAAQRNDAYMEQLLRATDQRLKMQ